MNNLSKKMKIIIGYKELYLMMLPAVLYYIIFRYVPIYGIIIAFKDYSFKSGILGSDWVGLKHFIFMLNGRSFYKVFTNTLLLGFMKLIVGFPIPILFALGLNEIKKIGFKKIVQTSSYLPHFLSWVILGGMFLQIFSIHGPVNELFSLMGLKQVGFFIEPTKFRILLIITHVWKTMGWSSIIFLAAIAGIDPQMYEAARIDGAGRIKKMIHITLPSILPIVTIMFILSVGTIIRDDFDQIFNMYNTAVLSSSDVISTYVYRQGIQQMNMSYAAAVDLFKNIIALGLVVTANVIANRMGDDGYGIW